MLERAVCGALNHLLQDAAWARARLAPFAGQAARLSLPPFSLGLAITAEGLVVETGATAFEVEIVLPADTPLLAAQGAEAVAKAARISGSAEFAEALSFVLRNLRWDFEEDLSKIVGDIAAHRVAGLLAGFAAWQGQAARKLAENIAEYLTQEQPTLVSPAVVSTFTASVIELRDQAASLEQRIASLGG